MPLLILFILISSMALQAQPTTARAVLAPLSGSGVTGEVAVQRTTAGTRLLARVDGLAPGVYAFHLLDATTCDDLAQARTFDTQDRPHGGPHAPPDLRRPGDLGNLRIRHRDPVGRYDRIVADLPFDRTLGLALVVREGLDDFHTQPLGGAGAAVACGLIEPE
ncbi:MAG: superoxide dismutase family protein [Bacteroidota bacterium]